MESSSLDLRSLVDGLSAAELDELRDAVASRLCREKYGADTIEGLRHSSCSPIPERTPSSTRRTSGITQIVGEVLGLVIYGFMLHICNNIKNQANL